MRQATLTAKSASFVPMPTTCLVGYQLAAYPEARKGEYAFVAYRKKKIDRSSFEIIPAFGIDGRDQVFVARRDCVDVFLISCNVRVWSSVVVTCHALIISLILFRNRG